MASKIRELWSATLTLVTLGLLLAASADGAQMGKRSQSGRMAALLIIDVQDSFLPGGSVAVPQGEEVIPVINWIRSTYEEQFSLVVLTKDWHCDRHVSFASSHPGLQPFDNVTLRYSKNGELCLGDSITNVTFPEAINCPVYDPYRFINQKLWPDHAVMNVNTGPTSSKLSENLVTQPDDVLVTKGSDCHIDYYSAFSDVGGFGMTDLATTLQFAEIDTLFVTGLAFDYCVKYTAIDGERLGFDVFVVEDATRAMDPYSDARYEIENENAHIIDSVFIGDILLAYQGDTASRIGTLSPVVVIAWIGAYLML